MANSGSRVYRHHPLGADFLCFVPCTGSPYCSHADFEKQVVERAGLVLRLGIPRHPAFDPIVHRLLRFAEAEHHLGCVDRRYPDFCLKQRRLFGRIHPWRDPVHPERAMGSGRLLGHDARTGPEKDHLPADHPDCLAGCHE